MAEKEYIERDKVMDALLHEQYGYLCEDAINSIPAADVRPVVRGENGLTVMTIITVGICGLAPLAGKSLF